MPGGFPVLSEKCRTCILRPDDSITRRLPAGRIRQLINEARRQDTYVSCHETTEHGRKIMDLPPGPQAACRGFWDAFGGGQIGRIAERMNTITYVDPPLRSEAPSS